MADTLSQAQIAKYAARLQGQRLLPILQEWQIKRAIVRLAGDGSRPSLDAIKRGIEKGLLGKPPYSALLEIVLTGSIATADAKRVRAHLSPPEPIKQPETPPRPWPQREWSSGVGMGTPAPPPAKVEPQRFSTTNNPIQLLREQLKASTPLESYRIELRERVRQDSSRRLLQEICELWDRSLGSQKEALRELITFIELVPERPLWLRRNVALDCDMPWQLADDSPAIAHYLVDTIQLRTRKLAIISACRKLRREDTKTEIYELWFKQYKQGVHDNDFDYVLLKLGFLPKEPLEQRVAIALTCGWAERLAHNDTEVLVFLLPLLDHPRLGAEARRALKNIKNPSTLKALKNAHQSQSHSDNEDAIQAQDENDNSAQIHTSKTKTSNGMDRPANIDIQCDKEDLPADLETEQIQIRSEATKSIQKQPNFEEVDKDQVTCQEEAFDVDLNLSTHDSTKHESQSDNLNANQEYITDKDRKGLETTIPEGSFSDNANTVEEQGQPSSSVVLADEHAESRHKEGGIAITGVERLVRGTTQDESSEKAAFWESIDYLDAPWVKKLEHYVHLRYEEKLHIVSQIARSDRSIEDWIEELLYEQPEQQECENEENRNASNELAGFLGIEPEDCNSLHIAKAGLPRIYNSDDNHRNLDRQAGDTSSHTNRNERPEALMIDYSSHDYLDSASVFLIKCATKLLNKESSDDQYPYRELLAYLLTFHIRERIADIKAYEEAMESNQDSLRNNSDCIAGAILEEIVPYMDNVYAARYRFDPQQSFRHSTQKEKSKPKVISQQSHTLLEIDSIDNTTGIATLLVKAVSKDCLDHEANFIYIPPNFSQSLRQDLAQQASQWINGNKPLSDAFNHLLQRRGSERIDILNQNIINDPSNKTVLISDFLRSSDGISLVIQGPPGSGKTSCAAEVICNLAKTGLKIGVSANSHLAIDTLLLKASSVAQACKQNLRIAKYQPSITTDDRTELMKSGIRVINKNTFNMLYDVYGGTVYAFSKQLFENLFDLLVIDEASQVPLASLLAMARCARNILLIGDQQQLAQPVIANHPAESGLSSLSYATSNQQVVDTRIGIFLPKSWRMHPSTCGFISSSFYEERLLSHQQNNANSIQLSSVKNGILYLPVEHENNRVFAAEEAEVIREITSLLIGQQCSVINNSELHEIVISWDHIAIMAPYNAQVSLIQRVLGPDARVGTVDRFQGQEAPISIYSLTTSHGENPTALEFILNRNRVNVALSRSQCLSIIVGSTSLTSILNSSPDLSEERKLLFSLTDYIGTSSVLSPRNLLDAATPLDPEETSQDMFLISDGFKGPAASVPLPNDLKDPSTIKLARKLFKFSLDSKELLKLYQYRLFDELALFLDFCSWDKTEKPWEQTKLLMRLAASPNATPLLLVKLAKRGEWKTREAVAANPKTPLHVIKDLIGRESVMGRRGAALNPALPQEIYWELLSDYDELVGRSLASNPSTPMEILHQLIDSSYEITSRRAQENLLKRASRECTLGIDSNNSHFSSSSHSLQSDSPLSLASDPSIPASVLASLVASKDQKVRSALAANPSIGSDEIHALAFDSNDAVRIKLAERTDLPSDVLTALAFDQSRFVRRILAENPACTEDAFKRLVSDSDVYVRERIAKQTSLSPRVCSWLLAENEARVSLAFSDNAGIPLSHFADAQRGYYKQTLAGSKSSAQKSLLLINPSCPIDKLTGVAVARDPSIQLAIALSLHSNATTLQSLQSDKEPVVRNAARARLAMIDL